MSTALQATELTCTFGGITALDAVSVHFTAGKVTSIVGPNGSGKSTLIDCLTGFQRPGAGRVRLAETDISDWSRRRRARAGLRRTFQAVHVFGELTLIDHLVLAQQETRRIGLVGEILRSPAYRRFRTEATERAHQTLRFVELHTFADRPAQHLSYGQQKLLGLACGLVAQPAVLCLDEPLAGVNPLLVESLQRVVMTLREQGQTLLVVEHNMDFVAAVSDAVVVLSAGSVLAEGPPSVLHTEDVLQTLMGTGAAR